MERTLNPEFNGEMIALLESINHQYNYDFRQYAPSSMKRCLVHAMNRMGFTTLKHLHEKVLVDTACFNELIQSLTIPVSEMFRDPSYFLSLKEKVIPYLKTYPSIKIWVAGCSTGEEVYSLAILLKEAEILERTTIYATDINGRNLEKAEKGVFSRKDMEAASVSYAKSGGNRALQDYYEATGDSIIFDPSLKKNITFSDHSLVTDAVFSETHLISCRNVLIYFNRDLQNKAFGLFHESLCRKGFLGLGSKETIHFSHYAKDFDNFTKSDRIFQKK